MYGPDPQEVDDPYLVVGDEYACDSKPPREHDAHSQGYRGAGGPQPTVLDANPSEDDQSGQKQRNE